MVMNRKPALLLAGLAALALVWAGCKGAQNEGAGGGGATGQTPDRDVILIGHYGSMTGDQATFGKSTDNGIRLAIEEINAAGGLNGKKLEVRTEDTASDAQKAETAVKRLVDMKVTAVLGEVASSHSMAGGPICQRNQIPMISPSSTNPKVTEIGDYIFRVCFIDPYQAAVVARFARSSLNAKTAAIFYDAGQAYSVGFRDEFKKAFTQMGGTIVQEASYTSSDKDFKAQLTRIKAATPAPDCILVPGYYTQAGTIVKQARDLDINVPILGGDGWDSQDFHTYAGANITNAYFSNHMATDDPNPTVKKFVEAYKAKYGATPDALAALGYDSAKLLFDAMKRARSLNGPDLRDAIAATKDFDGVSGKITMNAQRNADKSAVILEVYNGTFRFKERIEKP